MSTSIAKIVALDGPSASGKGTLARKIALELGFDYLDTGRIYRIVAYFAKKQNIHTESIMKVMDIVHNINWSNVNNFNEKELQILKSEDIGNYASKIATIPEVRYDLVILQRSFIKQIKTGIVVDGRDVGTTIFPEAKCKIFIDASLQARAWRRFKQLQNKHKDIIYHKVLSDIKSRDERDINRNFSPLMIAEDATVMDTTYLTINQSLNMLLKYTKTKLYMK